MLHMLPTMLLEAAPNAIPIPSGVEFVPKVSLGQILEISGGVAFFAWTIIRRYLGSEEDSDDVKRHEKLLQEMHIAQLQLGNLQAGQQEMIKDMNRSIERLNDRVFFNPQERGNKQLNSGGGNG